MPPTCSIICLFTLTSYKTLSSFCFFSSHWYHFSTLTLYTLFSYHLKHCLFHLFILYIYTYLCCKFLISISICFNHLFFHCSLVGGQDLQLTKDVDIVVLHLCLLYHEPPADSRSATCEPPAWRSPHWDTFQELMKFALKGWKELSSETQYLASGVILA